MNANADGVVGTICSYWPLSVAAGSSLVALVVMLPGVTCPTTKEFDEQINVSMHDDAVSCDVCITLQSSTSFIMDYLQASRFYIAPP